MRAVPLVAACLLAAGCAMPEHTYVADAPDGVYLRYPAEWTSFSAAQISKAEENWQQDRTLAALASATSWQAAIDASGSPSLEHVFANDPASQPTVYAYVRTLFDEEKAGASVSALRDMYLPLSDLKDDKNLKILTEDRVAQGAYDGLRLRYTYKARGDSPEQTVAQMSYLAKDSSKVYMLTVRCTTTCFNTHAEDIDDVLSSFTIKEAGRP